MPFMSGTSFRRGGVMGKMRESFTIVEYVDGENTLGMGGAKTRTVRYSGIRGLLSDLSSAEKERDSRLMLDSTHEIIIYSRGLTLRPKYVLELSGTTRAFEIVGMTQYQNRNETIALRVREYNVDTRPQPA